MNIMFTIKGHFNGDAIVLDEPASLTVGQEVRVVIDSEPPEKPEPARPSLFGFAKGTFEIRDDFNDPLEEFAESARTPSRCFPFLLMRRLM
jgi:hypothetical protein